MQATDGAHGSEPAEHNNGSGSGLVSSSLANGIATGAALVSTGLHAAAEIAKTSVLGQDRAESDKDVTEEGEDGQKEQKEAKQEGFRLRFGTFDDSLADNILGDAPAGNLVPLVLLIAPIHDGLLVLAWLSIAGQLFRRLQLQMQFDDPPANAMLARRDMKRFFRAHQILQSQQSADLRDLRRNWQGADWTCPCAGLTGLENGECSGSVTPVGHSSRPASRESSVISLTPVPSQAIDAKPFVPTTAEPRCTPSPPVLPYYWETTHMALRKSSEIPSADGEGTILRLHNSRWEPFKGVACGFQMS